MIIYSDRKRKVPLLPRIVELQAWSERAGSNREDARTLLLDLGELECALLDLEMPHEAGWLEQAMHAAAQGRLGLVPPLLARLRELDLPAAVEVSTPEGFAFYGLFPETYGEAAVRFADEQRPQWTAVIGIRTIGATLSIVASQAIVSRGGAVYRTTVRPEGHPFDRQVRFSQSVRAELAAHQAEGWYVIVDEGPGLSGSSFAAVVEALLDVGVPEGRIALFPSWDPDPQSLWSERARRVWPLHRRYVVPFERRHAASVPQDALDISAGTWRGSLWNGSQWPAVHPNHERRKYLTNDGRMYKFVGLGSYGQRALTLTQHLAAAGFTASTTTLSDGFIEGTAVRGEPMHRTLADTDFLDHAARYLSFRTGMSVPESSTDFHSLVEMIETNCRDAGLTVPDVSAYESIIDDQPAVCVDGRMLPQEWMRTGSGWLKHDAVDHHRDHFLPGGADIAWDIAGLTVEFGLDSGGRDYLCERYSAYHRDAALKQRLRFFRIAYGAFRLGYAALAIESLRNGDEAARKDAARFEALRLLYVDQVSAAIGEPQ